MRRMVVDAATAEVVGALRGRAVRPILIKGATIARWLYPPGSRRTYIDVDLLIRPADYDRAAEVLAALGYRQLLPEPAIGTPAAGHPSWYAVHFTRAGARQADVDLHQTVFWATVDQNAVWELMSRGTEAITIGGVEVEAPGYAARRCCCRCTRHNTGSSKGPDRRSQARRGEPRRLAVAEAARARHADRRPRAVCGGAADGRRGRDGRGAVDAAAERLDPSATW